MKPKQFWMVYGIGKFAPNVMHHTRESAAVEAKRLAREAPGVTFVVLEAIGAVTKREFDTVTFRAAPNDDADDGIPF